MIAVLSDSAYPGYYDSILTSRYGTQFEEIVYDEMRHGSGFSTDLAGTAGCCLLFHVLQQEDSSSSLINVIERFAHSSDPAERAAAFGALMHVCYNSSGNGPYEIGHLGLTDEIVRSLATALLDRTITVILDETEPHYVTGAACWALMWVISHVSLNIDQQKKIFDRLCDLFFGHSGDMHSAWLLWNTIDLELEDISRQLPPQQEAFLREIISDAKDGQSHVFKAAVVLNYYFGRPYTAKELLSIVRAFAIKEDTEEFWRRMVQKLKTLGS